VVECRQAAQQLSSLCGSPSDIVLDKCTRDLDTALNDIEQGLDDRQLELNHMSDQAQRCTSCLDVCWRLRRAAFICKTDVLPAQCVCRLGQNISDTLCNYVSMMMPN